MARRQHAPRAPTALETRRLDLRALGPAEAPVLHRLCDEPAVRRYLFDDEPVSLGEVRAMIGRSEKDFAAGGVGLFGLRPRDAKALIGFCGLFVVEGMGEPELTYALHPSWWGRGLATEAARAVASHALEAAGLRRVLVAADGANASSARVIEKLGARPLGKISPASPGGEYFEIAREQRQGWTP